MKGNIANFSSTNGQPARPSAPAARALRIPRHDHCWYAIARAAMRSPVVVAASLAALLAAPLAAAEPCRPAESPRAAAQPSASARGPLGHRNGLDLDESQPGLLAELEFAEGSTRLPDASVCQLVQVATWARDHFDGLVIIDGHADASGPEAGNVRLSLRRARLVRDQLLALGVDPSQIVISAFGPEGRRHARVAVWGTRDSLEDVIAKRRVDEPRRASPARGQPRQARPSPAPRRSL